MRYPPEYKEKARQKVIETAGALAKQNGFGTTGVDALMAAAGFTTGAFYSHFGSRAELLKAIVENELRRTSEMFQGKDSQDLLQVLKYYLSLGHVKHPEKGCMIPALSSEVARADDATKASFESLILELKDGIQGAIQDDADAWSIISQAVGAVVLARALATDSVRQELLSAAKDGIQKMVKGGD